MSELSLTFLTSISLGSKVTIKDMSTNFPDSIDTFTKPSSVNKLNEVPHSSLHGNEIDSIIALENYVGEVSSSVTSSLTYKITHLSSSQIFNTSTIPGLTLDDALAFVPYQSTSSIEYYINADSGSDSAAGTLASPLLTMSEAVRRMPFVIGLNRNHSFTMTLMSSSNKHVLWPMGTRFLNASVNIRADESNSNWRTIVLSSSAGASSTASSILGSFPGSNDYQGMHMEFTSGNAIGQRRLIYSSSNSSIVPMENFSIAPADGDSYIVFQPNIEVDLSTWINTYEPVSGSVTAAGRMDLLRATGDVGLADSNQNPSRCGLSIVGLRLTKLTDRQHRILVSGCQFTIYGCDFTTHNGGGNNTRVFFQSTDGIMNIGGEFTNGGSIPTDSIFGKTSILDWYGWGGNWSRGGTSNASFTIGDQSSNTSLYVAGMFFKNKNGLSIGCSNITLSSGWFESNQGAPGTLSIRGLGSLGSTRLKFHSSHASLDSIQVAGTLGGSCAVTFNSGCDITCSGSGAALTISSVSVAQINVGVIGQSATGKTLRVRRAHVNFQGTGNPQFGHSSNLDYDIGTGTFYNKSILAVNGDMIVGPDATIARQTSLSTTANPVTPWKAKQLDVSSAGEVSASIKIIATSDTPVVSWSLGVPTTNPTGYMKIDVSGSSRYIPFWT